MANSQVRLDARSDYSTTSTSLLSVVHIVAMDAVCILGAHNIAVIRVKLG